MPIAPELGVRCRGSRIVVALLAVCLGVITASPAGAGNSAFAVAQYLQSAAPPAAAGAHASTAVRCKRVCVKAGRGSERAPAQCLQWKTVC
jgi:hypothetical protein